MEARSIGCDVHRRRPDSGSPARDRRTHVTPPHATTDPVTEPLPMLASSRESRLDTVISRPYLGVGLATLGASVLAYFTFLQGFYPAGVPESWLTVLGLATLSAATGVVTTLPAILQTRRATVGARQQARRRDQQIPALVAGMEEVLDRWMDMLLAGIQMDGGGAVDPKLELELHVFARVDGLYRIVASSASEGSSVRRVELEEDEGVVGAVVSRNMTVVAAIQDDGNVQLFTKHRGPIGVQPPLRPANLEKCHPEIRWVYAVPIFGRREGAPWLNRTIGVLAVDGLHAGWDDSAFAARLGPLTESLAAQLSRHVGAIQSVVHPASTVADE